MVHRPAFQLLVCALIGSLSQVDPAKPAGAVVWMGADGLIDREIVFRTSELTDWISLWRGQFDERPTPLIDFDRYEVVGIILPKERAPGGGLWLISEEHEDRVIITYRPEFMLPGLLGSGPPSRSRYAFLVIPRTSKEVYFKPDRGAVENGLLRAETTLALELDTNEPDVFPLLPLGPSGGSGSISDRSIGQTVHAGQLLQTRDDRTVSLVHYMITPMPSLDTTFAGSGGEPFDPNRVIDRYVQVQTWRFTTKGEPLSISVKVDGRQHRFEVGGKTFDLRKGNFIQIDVMADRSLAAKQLPVVDLRYMTGWSERERVFTEHAKD